MKLYTNDAAKSVITEKVLALKDLSGDSLLDAMKEIEILAETFSKENRDNAISDASWYNVVNTLFPVSPKMDVAKKEGFTYRDTDSIILYDVCDETGKVTTKKLTFMEYAVEKAVLPENLLTAYDTLYENYVLRGTTAGINELKDCLNELTDSIVSGFSVNKSVIRFMLKGFSGLNAKGEYKLLSGEFSTAYRKWKNNKDISKEDKLKTDYKKVYARCVKIVYGIIAKGIQLQARNVTNISSLTYEQIEKIVNE